MEDTKESVKIPFYLGLDEAFEEGIQRVDPLMRTLNSSISKRMPSLRFNIDPDTKSTLSKMAKWAKAARPDDDAWAVYSEKATYAMRSIEAELTRLAERTKDKSMSARSQQRVQKLVQAYSLLQQTLKRNVSISDFVQQATVKNAKAERERQLAITATQKTIANLNAKLEHWRNLISKENSGGDEFNNLAQKIRVAQTELNELNSELSETAIGSSALGEAARHLGNFAIKFLGLSQFMDLTTSIRDITMEFERQEVALRGILRNGDLAKGMLYEITQMAVKSPFEIKDLIKYTKNLAAFQIQTNELVGTMTRLADVSAGVGVDMQQLILAYGQVNAAGVLRGQELRQFYNAGVPLADMLAQAFSAAEGVEVSIGQVFARVAEGQVSFEMVKEAIEDMTDAGGSFFRTQEDLATSLWGKWENLKDAVSLTYREIGNSTVVNGAMNGFISLALKLVQNVNAVKSAVGITAAAIAAYSMQAIIAAESTRKLAMQKTAANAASVKQAAAETKLGKILRANNSARYAEYVAKYAAAFTKAATGTNMFIRALNKLKLALLSNPFTAIVVAVGLAISAVSALVRALDKTKKALKEARESVEKFDTTTRELHNIAKNYEESRLKLNALTKGTQAYNNELSRMQVLLGVINKYFPKQSKFFGDMSNNIGDAVESLTMNVDEATRNARERLLAERAELQRLLEGRKLKYNSDIGRLEEVQGKTPSKKRRAELQAQIADIDSKLLEMESRELIGWRKTIQEVGKFIARTGAEVSLFDVGALRDMGNFTDAASKVVSGWKAETTEIEKLRAALSQATKDNDTDLSKDLEGGLKVAESRKAAYERIAKALNINLTESPKGWRNNDPLTSLQNRFNEVQEIYKKYQNLLKSQSVTNAQQYINAIYGDGKELDYLSPEAYQAKLQGFYSELQRLISDDVSYSKISKTGAQRLSSSLRLAISGVDDDSIVKAFEIKIEELKRRISDSKEARDFYKGIIDATGDKGLAQSLTLSIFGTDGADIEENIKEQLRAAFANIDLKNIKAKIGESKVVKDLGVTMGLDLDIQDNVSRVVNELINSGDFEKLRTFLVALPETQRKVALDILNSTRDESASLVRDLVSLYEKTKTFADRIQDIEDEHRTNLEQINNAPIPDAEKEALRAGANKKRERSIADVNLEELKENALWVRTFDELDKVSQRSIDLIRARIEAFKAENTGMSESVRAELDKLLLRLDEAEASRRPLTTIKDNIDKIKDAWQAMKEAEGNEAQAIASNSLREAFANLQSGVKGLSSNFSTLKTAFDSVSSLFDVDNTTETGAAIEGISESLGLVVTALSAVGAMLSAISVLSTMLKASNPALLAVTAGLVAVLGAWNAIRNAKAAKIQKQIDKLKDKVDDLSDSFERLKKAAEESFGSDIFTNFEQEIQNLEATAKAYDEIAKKYEKKAKSGKRKNRKEAKQEAEQARKDAEEARREAEELRESLAERLLGSSLAEAARSFASAWLDAYKSFDNTADAIEEKFAEMTENMVIEALAGKVMQEFLAPVYDAIENNGGQLTAENITEIMDLLPDIDQINQAMTVLMNTLKAKGYNLRSTASGLTGISKDIASASEESILGLAAGINTQNFYISGIYNVVQQIYASMAGSAAKAAAPTTTAAVQSSVSTEDYFSYLPTISQNTADTVKECKNIVSELRKVIVPRSTRGTYKVVTE